MDEEKPRPHQLLALEAIAQAKTKKENRYLVVLPTGAGKTYLSAFETKNINGKLLYIVHRQEIINQAKKVFQKIHNISKEDVGEINQKKKQIDRKITFAMIQTLWRNKNLTTIPKNAFEYIIVDEWHHAAAESYKKVLSYFKPKYLLALTATPYRSDNRDILTPINSNIPYKMELKEGINKGILVPFVYYGLWDDVDYSDIEWNGHKYREKDLNKKLIIDKRDDRITQEVKDKLGSKKCIGFCCSVKHVKNCVKKFNAAGIPAEGLSYKTKEEHRKQIIHNFTKGDTQVIFTKDIFNEGVDFPEVDGLLFLRPTQSKTVFFQQLGRGLRHRIGKKNVVVLDFIGNYASAYKTKHWLNEVVATGEHRPQKPEYAYNVPEVHFDSKVIDLFEMQEPPTKEKLIEDYYRLKNVFGRQPVYNDFCYKNHLSKYSAKSYESLFGGWTQFLHTIGERGALDPRTVREVKGLYYTLKEKFGRSPKQREIVGKIDGRKIEYKGVMRSLSCDTWKEAREKLGDPIKKITKQDILKEYLRIKNSLNKIPSQKEFEKHASAKRGLSVIGRLFGKYTNLIKEAGDYDNWLKQYNISTHTRKQLSLKVNELKQSLGHVPTFKEFYASTGISQTHIEAMCGSYNQLLVFSDNTPQKLSYSKEKLIKHYANMCLALEKTPTQKERNNYGKPYTQAYITAFGSWANFLKAYAKYKAGLKK